MERVKAIARVYWLHAITPLHVGTGRGVGFIDLPISREKTTGWPIVPGSSIKGVWRRHFADDPDKKDYVETAFGLPSGGEEDHAGSLVVTDARIVLLPVRSFFGTFAYVTSSLVLTRLSNDLDATGIRDLPAIPFPSSDQTALVPDTSTTVLAERNAGHGVGKMFLQDLDFVIASSPETSEWARLLGTWLFAHCPAGPGARPTTKQMDLFLQRLVVLPDDCFDFLTESGTEVAARVRIEDKTKTVSGSGLWYEESLPAESVLAGLVWCDQVYGSTAITADQMIDSLFGRPFTCQIGGKSTVGKGHVKCTFGPKEV